MFCVIQEIELKKENTGGAAKELIVKHYKFNDNTQYYYSYSDERFKREIKKAYKITIHESYRENGKVKKKQYYIATMEHYSIIDYSGNIFDYMTNKEQTELLEKLKLTEAELCEIVYKKLDPLIEKIRKDFEETEEYVTAKRNKEIIRDYNEKKTIFEKKYGDNTYDYCYDVFGELRNSELLEKIKKQYEAKEKQRSSYYENYRSNYNNNYKYNSSYSNLNQSNYNEEEKKHLKKIYKVLALHFHPDKETGDSEIMKTVNKLKEDWGL